MSDQVLSNTERKAIAKKFKNWKGTTNAKVTDMENSDTPADVEEVKVEIKKQTSIDKATETDTQLCEDINENSEEAQNDSTTVEPTSVDRADRPSSAELYFDNKENSADEKSSKKAIQPIVAGVVGAVLLVSCVALYIVKMPVVAAVVGIVGLACISFALYHSLKPNAKIDKVQNVEQLDRQNLKASGMLERS